MSIEEQIISALEILQDVKPRKCIRCNKIVGWYFITEQGVVCKDCVSKEDKAKFEVITNKYVEVVVSA